VRPPSSALPSAPLPLGAIRAARIAAYKENVHLPAASVTDVSWGIGPSGRAVTLRGAMALRNPASAAAQVTAMLSSSMASSVGPTAAEPTGATAAAAASASAMATEALRSVASPTGFVRAVRPGMALLPNRDDPIYTITEEDTPISLAKKVTGARIPDGSALGVSPPMSLLFLRWR